MANDNVLGGDSRPRFFRAGNSVALGFQAPPARRDIALRTSVRSLAGMQKEAVVVSSATPHAWRLVSDEGPYLEGYDEAPFPLAFMTAGMVASYWNELTALAAQRDITLEHLQLTLDNRYTMEGSALRGTMVGGALPPELDVSAESPAETSALHDLCALAVDASPVTGLLRGENISRFTLTHNGDQIEVGKVAALDEEPATDPDAAFEALTVAGSAAADPLMRKVASAEATEGEGGVGSSLRAEQKRTLHVRGTCTMRPDGLRGIDVQLFKPVGSNFRFLTDEQSEAGDGGRAPDALTLVAAGIGFCFLTQFGRYATIKKAALDGYRIVQDTHFSVGGATGGTGRRGEADPVDTHVHVDSREDEEFARTLLDMGEQTCFLHALCRTDLRSKVRLSRATAAS